MKTNSRLGKCPKCGSTSSVITPQVFKEKMPEVWGCRACGYTYDSAGREVITDPKQVADHLRAGEHAEKIFGVMKGLPPALRAAVVGLLVEYGSNMWYEGLKQGLLLSTIGETKNGNGKTQPG